MRHTWKKSAGEAEGPLLSERTRKCVGKLCFRNAAYTRPPLQRSLAFKTSKYSCSRHGDHAHVVLAFPDGDEVFFVDFKAGLAVEGQHDVSGLGLQADVDLGGVRHDQGAVGEGEGGDGGHDDARHLGVDDGSAGGKRICRGACRGGHDEAVGPVGGQVVVVDVGFDVGQARQGALVDHHVVEHGFSYVHPALSYQLHLEPHAFRRGKIGFPEWTRPSRTGCLR